MEELYLGIDPSTVASGYAVMNRKEELIAWGVVKPNKKLLSEVQQAAFQYNSFVNIMNAYNIKGIACEDQHRGVNADTFKKLSRVSGYIMLLAGMYDIPLVMYHPASWRKITHGRGNATKDETLEWANETYDLTLKKKDRDISDGIGICTTGVRYFTGENENGNTGDETG